MNRRRKGSRSWIRVAAGAALVLATTSVPAQETAMLPVKPQELFGFLPGNLRTWELTRSTSEWELEDWLQARAVREYRRKPAEDEGKPRAVNEPSAPPPARTRIAITDTAALPGKVEHFKDFTPGEEEGYEKKRIEGWPAFLFELGENQLGVEMLVENRFLVEFTLENQPPRYLDEWLDRVDLAAMAKVPAGQAVALPEVVYLVRIDQLDPDKNRAYPLATASSERQDVELEEDAKSLAELIGEVPEIAPISDDPEPGEERDEP